MAKPELMEIGGEFHWLGFPPGQMIPWPEPHTWFALARDAFLAVWKSCKVTGTKLWLPSYFCEDVTQAWQRAGVDICRYEDDPRWEAPVWDTLVPLPGDIVLAVNFFGVRPGTAWQGWHNRYPDCILVEDHSHDALSEWALNSSADYAFSSIRKFFPVPDGAILWSPRELPLPAATPVQDTQGSALKLAAMMWKAEYLQNLAHGETPQSDLKDVFRSFQMQGEDKLTEYAASGISPWSRELVKKGFSCQWRVQRETNVRAFLNSLEPGADVEPLFSSWPAGHCPFNVVLLFSGEEIRNNVRSALARAGVYAPIHWLQQSNVSSDRTLDLGNRILTVPLDQRYNVEDAHDVAALVNSLVNRKEAGL